MYFIYVCILLIQHFRLQHLNKRIVSGSIINSQSILLQEDECPYTVARKSQIQNIECIKIECRGQWNVVT